MPKDFTQTSEAEAIKLLNEEVASLREQVEYFKDIYIKNKAYARHLEEELRRKNQCLADEGIVFAQCLLRYTLDSVCLNQ